MSLAKETSPSGIAAEFSFDAIKTKFCGGSVYFGVGSYSAVEQADIFDGMDHLATELAANADSLGELAEGDDALSIESTVGEINTRHYALAGKRESTLKVMIVGLSEAKKNYLESRDFGFKKVSLIALGEGDANDALLMNGLYWKCSWAGKVDGVWTVTLEAKFRGYTENVIRPYLNISENAPS